MCAKVCVCDDKADKPESPSEEVCNHTLVEQNARDGKKEAACDSGQLNGNGKIDGSNSMESCDLEISLEQEENDRDDEVDFDVTSSTLSVSGCCAQEDDGDTMVTEDEIIKFLNEIFRKRHVRICDFFPEYPCLFKNCKKYFVCG